MMPLRSEIGTGKTCVVRGFVRRRLQQPRARVTSPTFLLHNEYGEAPERCGRGVPVRVSDA